MLEGGRNWRDRHCRRRGHACQGIFRDRRVFIPCPTQMLPWTRNIASISNELAHSRYLLFHFR